MKAYPHDVSPERDVNLQGCYAGVVTRAVAFGLDVVVALTLFAIAASVGEYIVSALIGRQEQLRDLPILAATLLVAWWIIYSTYPVAQTGRTLGMAIVGLRIVRADGSAVDTGRALVRVLAFPFSFAMFFFGFALILFRRDRRALHDLVASTAVVYSWDARAARLRFLARSA